MASGMNRLYFITMDDGPQDHLAQVRAACDVGIRWIQLRMKGAGEEEYFETAKAALSICEENGCKLMVNDRVAIAARIGAHGVHLGNEDMAIDEARKILGETCIIGGTANTIGDIRKHAGHGADYIGLGPYRHTTTKKKLSPILGLDGYRGILEQLDEEGIDIPVVAIGGIVQEDIAGLMDAGVYGIAFSGLLVHAKDKSAMVRELSQQTTFYADNSQ